MHATFVTLWLQVVQPLANVHETKWTPHFKRETDVAQSYRHTSSAITRAVYPEHNLSSILTLSMPKWQVPTQEQNDPTDDASATRSTRGNRGTSYPWP